jgi:FkbM family methyltransferase
MKALLAPLKRLVPVPVRQLLKKALFQYRNRGFTPYVSTVDRFGEQLKFYVGDRVGESWHQGGWDWNEMTFVKENLVRPGDVVLECGAHHGEVTMFLSRWVGPSGRVISFEPVPRNAEIVRQQVALNDLKNVTVVNKAVGSTHAVVRMTDESNAQVAGPHGAGFDVETVPLDDFADAKPTFLKIDVEGFEAELLQGARQVLRTKPRLALEIHTPSLHRYKTSVEEIFRLFGAEGYDLWFQYPHDPEIRRYEGQPITRVIHLFGVPK